jgi:NADPH-dependent 2,4-dienoyl-CoA reductase/sulfur reductase-like enzyme
LKARAGKESDIKKCMRCLQCFQPDDKTAVPLRHQPGHWARIRKSVPAASRQTEKVLIAGGGIAGMQAALTAFERGHQVILCERTGQLGGALLCEEQVRLKNTSRST